MQQGLGVAGPEVEGATSEFDPQVFFAMISRVRQQFPNIKAVGTTLRDVRSTNRHNWGTVLWIDGQQFASPTLQLDVIDRIGGGDGFCSGLVFGLLDGRTPEQAMRLGWAHGALLTTFPGDVSMARLPEVEALAQGGSARVQR